MHRLHLNRQRDQALEEIAARSNAPRPKSWPPMLRTPPKPKRPWTAANCRELLSIA